ncbi:hypothetical protein KAJ27_06875, partial [bacterium]|nr:hypothetical protein [bacterium]
HRDTVLDEICTQLSVFIENAIKEDSSYGDLLLYTWIDLGSMKDSSFSLMAWLQMKPEAACYYGGIQLALLKICLSAANKYGWEILRFEHKVDHKPDVVGQVEGAAQKALPDTGLNHL